MENGTAELNIHDSKIQTFFLLSKVKFKPGCGIVRKWAFIGSGWCYVSAERSTPMM